MKVRLFSMDNWAIARPSVFIQTLNSPPVIGTSKQIPIKLIATHIDIEVGKYHLSIQPDDNRTVVSWTNDIEHDHDCCCDCANCDGGYEECILNAVLPEDITEEQLIMYLTFS